MHGDPGSLNETNMRQIKSVMMRMMKNLRVENQEIELLYLTEVTLTPLHMRSEKTFVSD